VRSRGERGSVLLLFPAAILITVALAAMAVDNAVAFLAQRELVNATAAAANDAATEALSDDAFYRGNQLELSASAVEAVAVDRVHGLVDGRRHHGLSVTASALPPAGPGCGWTVTVAASSRVDEVFGRAIPGSSGGANVKAHSTAGPKQGSGGC
jgi:hypothetical protein